MTIYVLSGFNNYYNRQIKRMENVTDYDPFVIHIQQDYNFVPNDNVNTQVVLGSNVNNYNGQGDYLLVVNELNQIVSRWFIIESVRDRAGQFTLTLHRDLVADHLAELMSAPMYVEKATLSESDPFIFNSEQLSLNQIKTKEYQIKDKSNCAWIVGYLSRDFKQEAPFTIKTVNSVYNEEMTKADFDKLILKANGYTIPTNINFKFEIRDNTEIIPLFRTFSLNENNLNWTGGEADIQFSPSIGYSIEITSHFPEYDTQRTFIRTLNKMSKTNRQDIINVAKMSITDSYLSNTETQLDFYERYNNKIIKVLKDDNSYDYYKINTKTKTNKTKYYDITTDKSAINGVNAIPTYLYKFIKSYSLTEGYFITNENGYKEKVIGRVYMTPYELSFIAEKITEIDVEYKIPDTRNHLLDAPYDMFCIPYTEDGLKVLLQVNSYDLHVTTMNAISTMSFAQQLAENLGTNLLDMQLLPYCPMSGWEVNNGEFTINTNGYELGKDMTFQYIGTTNVPVIVFYCKYCEGEINYEQLNIVDNETGEIVTGALPTTQGVKMSNQCDMYRLCSPNWNGQFEFNPVKCGDSWYHFNVDYTYLPYSPYIKINPNFSQLYGKDFDDARGLICQGDFSISYMSDQWVNYQVQNKNYQNVFDRGTKNLELNQKVERNKQIFGAVTGTLMGGAGGAAMGAKAGPVGAIAGAAVGTVLGAAGGIADVAYGDMLREEALDYRKDMFNYSLENIQALPDSIAKVTAYTKNNRIFPTLEYYTCTDTEKQALANKIAYNGMTTMRIGTIGEFVGNDWSYGDIESKGYIKGKLIRLETIEDDYHLINALSGELDKGVYIK